MQAITTRFAGPTNHRGARVIAKAEAGRVTHSWDYTLNIAQNHAAAARKLAESFGWSGRWTAGGDPSGCGYVFVNVGRGDSFTVAPAEGEG